MSDAFDKEGHYYEDSDFALDLNLQDKRQELLYLLEDDNALVAINSCRPKLINLIEADVPRRELNLLTDDNTLVDNSPRDELIQAAISSKLELANLLEADDILVTKAKSEQAQIAIPKSRQEQNHLEADNNILVSPLPSALPLPMWAKSDLVGNWLEQSMGDFTIKYYSDSVQEFFEYFNVQDKKYRYS